MGGGGWDRGGGEGCIVSKAAADLLREQVKRGKRNCREIGGEKGWRGALFARCARCIFSQRESLHSAAARALIKTLRLPPELRE